MINDNKSQLMGVISKLADFVSGTATVGRGIQNGSYYMISVDYRVPSAIFIMQHHLKLIRKKDSGNSEQKINGTHTYGRPNRKISRKNGSGLFCFIHTLSKFSY